MDSPSPAQRIIRFGDFEADTTTGELSRNGRRIPLQDKPFRVLVLLARRPGELVTRDELQRQLWPDDTFVDFEHGLNTAVKKLRQALEDSADSPRYVETLARRGYRLIAPVEEAIATAADAVEAADPGTAVTTEAPPAPLPRRTALQRHVALGVALALLTSVSVVVQFWGRSRPAPGTGLPISIAVLPFDNLSRNPDDEYLADGLSETLITELARVPGLLVIARNSSFQYKGRAADLRRVGSELGASHLVEGSIQRDGERLRVNAQLVDAASGHHVWAEKFDRTARDVFSTQDAIARGVRRALRSRLDAPGSSSGSERDASPEAYDAYLRGVYHYRLASARPGSLAQAQALLEQATALDPGFAPAHAALAQILADRFFYEAGRAELHEKASLAVQKALELEPNLAEAFAARADLTWTRLNHFPHDAAMADLRRALELSPSLVAARGSAARIYDHVGLFEKAFAELDAARRVDPKDLDVIERRGLTQLFQRDYAAALECAEAVGDKGLLRIQALWGLGRAQEAEAALQEFMRTHPDDDEGFAYHALVLARRGDRRAALAQVERAARLDLGTSKRHHTEYHIGAAYALLGEADRAVEWLERAASNGFPCYPWYASDPDLAPLAAHPRFREFMARLEARFERHRATL